MPEALRALYFARVDCHTTNARLLTASYATQYALKVRNSKSRKALARIVASDYPFALERFRHGQSAYRNGVMKLKVPRELRVCRFCAVAIESPEHALLICAASEALLAARNNFLVQIAHIWPTFEPPMDDDDALAALRGLQGNTAVLGVLGAFTHKVFLIFDAVELIWPDEFTRYKPVTPEP
ncbi:hypothetical protein PENSPDRAFT_682111 [Peniophora sp. CONT]|nr:hypothetical protein PENSPDRAFT_682111 [Peniophora sp. CONT]